MNYKVIIKPITINMMKTVTEGFINNVWYFISFEKTLLI